MHAGSMIFTNFDRHALYDIMEGTYSEGTGQPDKRYQYYAKRTDVPAGGKSKLLGRSLGDLDVNLGSVLQAANYSDQIPPFTVTLTGMNEYGNVAVMHILGVELINEGSGISIDDIVTETQMTFVARAIVPWKPLSDRGVFSSKGVLNQLNSLTAVKQAQDYGQFERSSRVE